MGFTTWTRTVRRSEDLTEVNLVLLRQVDSTNRYARSLLSRRADQEDSPAEFVVAAYEQTAGRGRLGRSWSSQAGLGTYTTIVKEVPADRSEASWWLQSLPLLVGVAICEAVAPMVRGATRLKWPNDVMIEGKKVGGILIETFSSGASPSHAIIGFGLNCGHSKDELPTPVSTSVALEAEGGRFGLGELFVKVLRSVTAGLRAGGDLEHAVERYRSWSAHQPGEQITCRIGQHVVKGSFIGFDTRGHLRLQTDRGEVQVAAGDVVEPATGDVVEPATGNEVEPETGPE